MEGQTWQDPLWLRQAQPALAFASGTRLNSPTLTPLSGKSGSEIDKAGLAAYHASIVTTQLRQQPLNAILTLALLTLLAWAMAVLPVNQVLLAVGTVAGAALLIRWPWLIWLGLAAVLPMAGAIKIGPLSATDLLVGLAIALWFADGVRRRRLAIQWSAALSLAAIYILSLLLSTLNATELVEAAKEVVKWVEFAAVVVLIPSMVPRVRAQWLAAALLIGGMGQALLGLYQFVNRIGPEWFIILGGYMRASGSFLQPNPYAGYLGLCLPVAVSLTLWSWGNIFDRRERFQKGAGDNSRWDRVQTRDWRANAALAIFYSSAALLIGAGLLASWSRGGWIGALAGVGAVVVFRSRRTFALSVALAVVILAAVLLGSFSTVTLPAPIAERVADLPAYVGLGNVLDQPVTDENFSVVERVAHWVAALRMWEQAPLFGVGPGNYEAVYPTVRLPKWEEALGHAHNIYLNVLGETGMVGFTAYLLLWTGLTIWVINQIRRAATGSWTGALALGILGVIIHLSVHNFFDNLFVQGMYVQLALWIGCLSAVETKHRGR